MQVLSKLIFSKKILIWYNNNFKKQNLPWQLHKTIYTVWLSEIMLQQTQVSTVIPYYKKFLQAFPTISKLAIADLNEILYIWSGLGYYKRAINLHKTAKIIMQNHNGIFPHDFKTILSFPGIGKSTAGAILSLALNQRHPILDSNVKRILIRYYALDYHKSNKSVIHKELWLLINQLLPTTKEVSTFNQAIMDFGRTICTYKHPLCNICPIHNHCKAFLTNNINQYTPKNIHKTLKRTILWILLLSTKHHFIWLTKRSQKKIWNNLFCFPEFYNTYMFDIWISTHNLHKRPFYYIIPFKCKISNINFEIHSILISTAHLIEFTNTKGIWYDLNNPPIIGLPKPVCVILNKLKKTSYQISTTHNKLNYIQKLF